MYLQANTILIGVLWFVALSWLVVLILTLRGLARQKFLLPTANLRLTASDAPLVSILVPARNEEQRVLAACVRSILAQDYGRFEVIAVNDRSTDATASILQVLAKSDERLRAIEGEELSPGWLGKPYAMQQALAHARGEWILATDADMIFEPSALRTALDRVFEAKGDALTLIPRFEAGSFWERVMIPTWTWVFLMFVLLYRVDDTKTARAAGIGGFFLVRRTVLDRLGGYEALKDEVMEDVRLAEMIKRSGASLLVHHAPALVRTRMYRTFGEMWECCCKNWFSGMNFSLPLALSSVASMYLGAVAPPLISLALVIALVAGADVSLFLIPAALSWLFQVLVMASASRRSEVSPVYALTVPLGVAVMYAILFDSSIRITTGRGVTWKGRRIYERHGVQPPRIRTTTMVGLLALTMTFPFASVVSGQKRSREEMVKEAGRIVTEAERKIGEARNNGDRIAIIEAERAAMESFVKAIELWREAGNDPRLISGVEELTRLYSVHGDYEKAVDRLKSEANYWLQRGDVKQQVYTLFSLGIRQWQMKRDPASIETFQQVIEMSRGAGFYSLERNSLEQLAIVYTRLGRVKDAEAAKASASELLAKEEPGPASMPGKPKPATIPAQWIDLPSAPLAAEYRDVEGLNQAVLVNRSTKGIEFVGFGCVLLDENNKTRVTGGLASVGLNHGGVRPGLYYRPFLLLNGPLNRWTDEKMSCEGAAKMAVIQVAFDDNTGWKAEGRDSVVH